jgi:3-deoxy-D-manno-octulosonic-acid transferase
MIFFYRIIINFIIILSPLIILIRLLKKKEHPIRFKEKFCFFSKKRGQGKLIWFHGASVGEILSIIPLIEKLEKNKNINKILITSSTLSSSNIFLKFKFKKTIHQFFPIDSNFYTKKFIEYWKPSLAIFIESEIWPNIILNLKNRNIPLILLNARISKKSYKKWKKISFFSRSIFNKFDVCLSQNNETKNYLKKLGAENIKKLGNLKFSETSFKNINKINKNTQKFFDSKKILFGAISTHQSEEIFCTKIHTDLKKKYINGVTIIVPRHIHRATEIKEEIEKSGLKVHLHSSGRKIDSRTDIYLVNSFGETKLFLKICKIVFLGGSLIEHGGQNPLEAARIGCKVIHGPNISNFLEVYNLLNKNNISSKIKTIKQARSIIQKNLGIKFSSKKIIKKLNSIGNEVLFKNQKEINKYI